MAPSLLTRRPQQVYGTAGGHARLLQLQRLGKAAGCYAVIVGLFAATFVIILTDTSVAAEATVALLALAGGCVAVVAAPHYWAAASKASVGARSERRVAEALGDLSAVVCHGKVIGRGGDADHIILGPMAAVIETKTGFGSVHVGAGGIQAGNRTIPGDALAQVARQAEQLQHIVKVPVARIVVVSEMRNHAPQVASGGAVVCGPQHLPEVIAGLPEVLSVRQARKIGKRIGRGEYAPK